jgi:hypothetical protein
VSSAPSPRERSGAVRVRAWRDAAIGFLAAAVPLGLPVAALTVRRASWRARRDDLPWLLSASLLLALSVIHGVFDWNLLGVALAWLVLRVGRRIGADPAAARAAGLGLGAGVLVLALWSIVQVGVLAAPRASGPPWFHHPNVLAHAWLPIAALLAVLPRHRWSPWPLLAGLAAVALAMTGSRSGALAALVGVVLLVPWGRWPRRRLVPLLAGAVLVAAALLVALPRPAWLDRLVGSWVPSSAGSASVNLLMASEDLDAVAVWTPLHVSVARLGDAVAVPVEWRVVRTATASWSRPQQSVLLEAGRRYTLSAEFRGVGTPGQPGWLGWGQDETGTHELTVWWDEDGAHGAVLGRLVDLEVAATPVGGGWTRLSASFAVSGDQPLRIGLGPNPDLSTATEGAAVDARALQLELGAAATAYAPGPMPRASAADLARGEALARLPLWASAWSGILERPLAGWGYDAFGRYQERRDAGLEAPAHPHNQVLATLFEGGLVGALAGVFLLLGLWRGRSRPVRAVLGALLVANLFDATLLAVAVLFPTAFLAGVADGQDEPRPRSPDLRP